MATPDGLFYAYAKNATDDVTWRYLIVFPSQTVADEWWRAVQASVASGYNRFAGVQRITNQYYTHLPNVNNGNISQTIDDPQGTPSFLGQVIFTLLNDRDGRIWNVIPVLNYTVPSSNSNFFIRSVLQPNLFWYWDGGAIRASTARRTRFNVGIAGGQKAGTIMIPSDQITISVASGNEPIALSPSGDDSLVTENLGTVFNYSDFAGAFAIRYDDNIQGGLETIVKVQDTTQGERWVLVF